MPQDIEAHQAKRAGTQDASKRASGAWLVKRNSGTGQFAGIYDTQVEAVMAAAKRCGLLHEKSGRIGGRVSPALVEQAKARTGINTDTDLIEFALANIALEDKFPATFKAARGKVNPDLKLGF
jgi:hypothetical protein